MKKQRFVMFFLIAFLLVGVVLIYERPASAEQVSIYDSLEKISGDPHSTTFVPKGVRKGGIVLYPESKTSEKTYGSMIQSLVNDGWVVRQVKYPFGFSALATVSQISLDQSDDFQWIVLGMGQGSDLAARLADESHAVFGLISFGKGLRNINLSDNDLKVVVLDFHDAKLPEKTMDQIQNHIPRDSVLITLDSASDLTLSPTDKNSSKSLIIKQLNQIVQNRNLKKNARRP